MSATLAGGDGLIGCTVGSRQFAFRASDVLHVSRADKLRGDSGDDGRIGILKMSGQTIPVFRLGRTLGEPANDDVTRDADQHIAVTGRPGELVGWLVDRLARAVVADGTTIMPLPRILGARAAAWFDALVRLGDHSVLLLAPHRFGPFAAPRIDRCDSTESPAVLTPQVSIAPMTVLFSTPALPNCTTSRYAISARQMVAIVQDLPQISVPGCAEHVTGVGWWRHTAVPLIDFRNRAERAAAGANGRCLLVRCGATLRGTIVALPIDSDVAVHKPASADRNLDATSLPPFVDGAFQVGGDTAALLNLDALLTINQES